MYLGLKKTLAISLLFIYCITAMGISLKVHLCGDNISSIALFETNQKKCACAAEKDNDCCKDLKISPTIDDLHALSVHQFLSNNKFTSIFFKSYFINQADLSSLLFVKNKPMGKHPPNISGNYGAFLLIYNQVFRI